MQTPADTFPADFLRAVHSKAPSDGFTHRFYRYPARFSPQFARAAIGSFSSPGDVVMDPFMGSGTTLVEAMLGGRHAIGSDISTLANFVASAKTTVLAEEDINEIERWIGGIPARLNLRRPVHDANAGSETGYTKGVPWPIRKTIQLAIEAALVLGDARRVNFVRCALLSTAQQALDCTTHWPTASEFRERFVFTLREHVLGMRQLGAALANSRSNTPSVVCLRTPAADLQPDRWPTIKKRPSLVVTSPPYPRVHVLYHRWQIKGRRETPAPFWIAGSLDGAGASYYTMGSRTETGTENYFSTLEASYKRIHSLLAPNATVVQLVAFSDIGSQLPRYLKTMLAAGFSEHPAGAGADNSAERIWRDVPLRRWYASYNGKTSSSKEVLLVHQRID